MKKITFLLILIVAAIKGFAQNTLVVSLSHGANITMYYGTSAFANAMGAADNGDVICLSDGTFVGVSIDKAVSIRGTGNTRINVDNNSKNISISSVDDSRFSAEGIIFSCTGTSSYQVTLNGTSSNQYFIKCKFEKGITYNSTSSEGKVKLVNCDIKSLSLNGLGKAVLVNSLITGFTNATSASSNAEFFNCMVDGDTKDTYYRTSFINCILYFRVRNYNYESTSLSSDATAMNCIFVNFGGGNQIDCYKVGVSEVFASYENKCVDSRYGGLYADVALSYELSEEAKTKYVGTDGKEIGMFGGQYPYNLIPNYPIIKSMNTAKQATVDNKLSVDIEISATE